MEPFQQNCNMLKWDLRRCQLNLFGGQTGNAIFACISIRYYTFQYICIRYILMKA